MGGGGRPTQPASDPAQGPGALGLAPTIGPAPKQSLPLSLLSPHSASIKLLLWRVLLSGWSRISVGGQGHAPSLDLPLLSSPPNPPFLPPSPSHYGQAPSPGWALVKVILCGCGPNLVNLQLLPGTSSWKLRETPRPLFGSVRPFSYIQGLRNTCSRPFPQRQTQGQTQMNLGLESHLLDSEQDPHPP